MNTATSTASLFDLAVFSGKGWSYAEVRDPRSAMLALLTDYSSVKLSMDWLHHLSVDGETRRTRILANTSHVPLNADHFFDLWINKEKIPEAWKGFTGFITFDGDILLDPDGDRCVLCLGWLEGKWWWNYYWLVSDWNMDTPSAVLVN